MAGGATAEGGVEGKEQVSSWHAGILGLNRALERGTAKLSHETLIVDTLMRLADCVGSVSVAMVASHSIS